MKELHDTVGLKKHSKRTRMIHVITQQYKCIKELTKKFGWQWLRQYENLVDFARAPDVQSKIITRSTRARNNT